MIPVVIIYRGLEIFFFCLSLILYGITCVVIVYQLAVLYVPYWIWRMCGDDKPFTFPDYYYQVYGDNVQSLEFEHYGYLIGAIGVCGLSGPHLLNSLRQKNHLKSD